ncbi:MAG: aromatic-ring-hydroxylating dioxygenase subunit beta, partial [Xanthobacteraceae bacterium]
MTMQASVSVTRAEVEDFLFMEAELLDNWRLKEWEELLAEDACYYIPPNDDPEGSHRTTLYIIADDRERIHQRIIRVMDPNCHAEFPKSHLSRILGNVRILSVEGDIVTVAYNFIMHRYRRYERMGEYVGNARYMLKRDGASFKIKERRMFLKSHELG